MKNILTKSIPIVLALAFAVWAMIRLVVQNGDLLYEAQEQSFWQPGELYYAQLMLQPGSLVSWIGQYLTQYFYYPTLGAAILVILWLVIYLLWIYSLRLTWQWCWLGLIIPVLLLFQVTSPGFYIYVSKVPDWWFTPTLYALVFTILQTAISWFAHKYMRYGAILIWIGFFGTLHTWASQCNIPQTLRYPFHPSLQDTRFHAEMRMERAAENADWAQIINEYKQCPDAPTRTMWVYKNIALLNQGKLLDDWLKFMPLTLKPTYNDSVYVAMAEGPGQMLYYLYGCIEFSNRWGIENMVEYGSSMKRLRLLTRCAMVKEEWELAEKYLNLLSRTTFQSQWADEQRVFLRHPERLAQDPSYRLPLLLSQSFHNYLEGHNGRVENYLITAYTTDHDHLCREHAEMSLMIALQTQNINLFWEIFHFYLTLHPGETIPANVQEAAYLFIKLDPESAPKHEFPFDKQIIERYDQFNARSQQLLQQGYQENQLPRALYKEFGKSYYWYFFFCRNIRTY